jgi:hypothetical protein
MENQAVLCEIRNGLLNIIKVNASFIRVPVDIFRRYLV